MLACWWLIWSWHEFLIGRVTCLPGIGWKFLRMQWKAVIGYLVRYSMTMAFVNDFKWCEQIWKWLDVSWLWTDCELWLNWWIVLNLLDICRNSIQKATLWQQHTQLNWDKQYLWSNPVEWWSQMFEIWIYAFNAIPVSQGGFGVFRL